MSGDTPGAIVRRYDLSLALAGWQGARADAAACVRYEAAQGLVYSLLQHADRAAANAFHDANVRKAVSISPVTIRPLSGGLARANLQLAVWERSLIALMETALRGATDAPLRLGQAPALLLAWQPDAAWTIAELLATPAANVVRVRFESPTLFSFGRHPNGRGRMQLVPDPGLVVASWLRAWKLTGDHALDWLPPKPEQLGEAIALTAMRDVHTVTVTEQRIPLVGFVGDCAYRWEGRENGGRSALATLARFAAFCGTGAKTGRGFGQTRLLHELAPASLVPRSIKQGANA